MASMETELAEHRELALKASEIGQELSEQRRRVVELEDLLSQKSGGLLPS